VKPLRLVMMGTGEFAFPTFAALYVSPHQVLALYTQPERTGRGHHRLPPNPLKTLAMDRQTPVCQPQNVNVPEVLQQLRELDADVFVVAAYGQILSPELLAIPHRTTINVHASLLPKYRGAAPVAYAIWKGETETGVSIIEVLPQLDAGPILAVASTPIAPQETAGELEDRLARMGPVLTRQVLDALAAGPVDGRPQISGLVSRAPKLRKPQGAIDWAEAAHEIDRHVRAMQPWPNAFSTLVVAGQRPIRTLVLQVQEVPGATSAIPGTVAEVGKDSLVVQTGQGGLELLRLQPEGKRSMSAGDFVRGYRVQVGDRFETGSR
jgi:methionyl-tRNA formyltransferase